MADQNRKNIYIPEDQAEMFKQAEEFAKNKGMSVSTLVIQAVSKFISDVSDHQGEVSLMIKTYNDEEHPNIPSIEYIKFIGEEIAKTPYREDCVSIGEDGHLSKYGKEICDIENYLKGDFVGHKYTIYKTKKEKYLVYTTRIHSRTFILSDKDAEQSFKQQYSYKIYDNILDLVNHILDLDNKTIDEIVKSESKHVFLDI